MDHFNEGRVNGNSLMAVEENHSSLGSRCRSHDGVYGLTFGEYRCIMGWSRTDVGWWWIVA